MKIFNVISALALTLSMSSALAAAHDKSLDACKAATLSSVGDAKVRLADLERSGKTYDFWLDVFVTGTDTPRMRSYCKVKGRTVLDLVTGEGTWGKSAKREVARQAKQRIAQR